MKRYYNLFGLLFLWFMMSLCFYFTLPVMGVDRLQESWYLGVPYERMKSGEMWIDQADPFPMNGPHIIYLLAKAAYLTQGLLAVRLIQWTICLLAAALLWLLVDQMIAFRQKGIAIVMAVSAMMAFAWISIPGALIYPVQTNGMLLGFCFLLAGLLSMKKSSWLPYLLFGFAYSCKAQYLSLLPGLILYRFFLDKSLNWPRHFLSVLRDVALFFVPTMLVWPVVFSILGGFRSYADVLNYALEGPRLLTNQLLGVMNKILVPELGSAEVRQKTNFIIEKEFSSFGILARFHVLLSLGSALLFVAASIWQKISHRAHRIPKAITMMSVVSAVYWLNYFKFYQWPYWYNTLAIMFFNVFWLPYLWQKIADILPRYFAAETKAKWVSGIGAFLVLIALLFQTARIIRASSELAPGDGLKPYRWMQGQPWNGDIN